MKKEIRAELRILKSARVKIGRDYQQHNRQILAASRLATRQHQRQIKAWLQESNRATKAVNKEINKIDRRILILEGRLS